jgi:hypothetical protein
MEDNRRPPKDTEPERQSKIEPAKPAQPEPLDEELLKQIGGGTDAPRGNW